MGFFTYFFGKKEDGTGGFREVSCKELFDAAAEFQLRQLSFNICVDMIANAIGRCEFRTYRDGEEVQMGEYWLWNYDPNPNENSTIFLHSLVDHLYRNNEALVIFFRRRRRTAEGVEKYVDSMVVADSWVLDNPQVTRQNEYRNVVVGDFEFNKVFREDDVLHLRLHNIDIKTVLDALTASWSKMAELAMKMYQWDRGEHWKVHISQVAAGSDQFESKFAKMIEQQIKPFLQGANGVLPEFDGYNYERMGASTSSFSSGSEDLRNLAADIFDFTARGFLIPAVLANGKVEATSDANNRFLTYVVDPLCDQLQEEIMRKRYGYELFEQKTYIRVDSSQIIHYDLFSQAASVEKLVGSGVYSINDILRAVGQGTINEPWADKHYLTKNMDELDVTATPLGQ